MKIETKFKVGDNVFISFIGDKGYVVLYGPVTITNVEIVGNEAYRQDKTVSETIGIKYKVDKIPETWYTEPNVYSDGVLAVETLINKVKNSLAVETLMKR